LGSRGLQTTACLPKTRHFQTQLQLTVFNLKRTGGSCWPIFKIKTDSVHEKFHLPFAARENLEGRKKF